MQHHDLLRRLAVAFLDHNKEFYLVGGTVRDELMGRKPHDIDCATNARPDEIKQIVATTNPLHIVSIGEKFGTIQVQYAADAATAVANSASDRQATPPILIEITTYRSERYTPGSRHPEVQFGTSLLEDLRRRDFTINAMAKDVLTGEIIDPFGGRLDLSHGSSEGLIIAVEDPEKRFTEDPLRMLRAARFAAQFGFLITPSTALAIRRHDEALTQISMERVRDEFSKILLSERPTYGFQQLRRVGLLFLILPEVDALIGVEQPPHHALDVFDHTLKVVELVPRSLEVRLAALLHDVAKPVTRSVDDQGNAHFYGHEDVGSEMAATVLRRLRFSNDVVEYVSKIVKLHMRVNAYTEKWSHGAVRRLFLDADGVLDDLLALAIADGSSDRTESRASVIARITQLRARLAAIEGEAREHPLVSPLSGNELMAHFGKAAGPWIGTMKQHLSEQVVEGTLRAGDTQGALLIAEALFKKMESEAR